MKFLSIPILSAVIFPLVFSACVSHPLSSNFNQQQAAKARVELALGYLQQNNFPLAKQNLDKALTHDPNYYLVYSAMAHFYQLQGEVEAARKAYLQAIKLDDKQGDTHNNFGTFLCAQGEFQQAYEEFERALHSPHYYRQADTYENMALCAKASNQMSIYQQALDRLRQLDTVRAEKLDLIK
ncbi:type IV pilus biogenesis/stability protein PilW [Rodentibacter trehalosifermentans]|uniref:Type IV pilus biogenesis/stability protein PilW n=1 Tax=Rodentibacter trehalosifermentans TaxID=1908263 RepID=A0A1V3J454_9PAST|nr:type IV pilus biogenesis/stability protein PilW [Rodentibacter trehalosifermentans]OOF49610.1 type IV pilus biogenesis/stability protein PilW [Rodentibacter trehalosifermentans]